MKTKTAKTKVKAKETTTAKPKVKTPKKVQAKAKPAVKPKVKEKPKLLVELINQKMEQQKTGGAQKTFGKFERGKPRNENNSNVGPSWGGRKGN